jgi:hypothetical protein
MGGVRYILQHRYMTWTRISTRITLGPNLAGLRGNQVMGSIIYTLVSSPRDSTRIIDSGWLSNLHIFDLINLLTSSSSCKNNRLPLYYLARGFDEKAWQLWRIKRPVNYRSGYLLPTSNSIPLDLNLGTWSKKPILLPHLGLTKNKFQWFSGYPVRPPGFSSRHRHGKFPAERIQVRIPGHIGRILGSYLHDMFQSWHSSFVAMTQLENRILQSF